MNKCLNLKKMNKLTKPKRNNIIINIATMEITAADFVNPLNLLLLFEYIYINTNFIFLTYSYTLFTHNINNQKSEAGFGFTALKNARYITPTITTKAIPTIQIFLFFYILIFI